MDLRTRLTEKARIDVKLKYNYSSTLLSQNMGERRLNYINQLAKMLAEPVIEPQTLTFLNGRFVNSGFWAQQSEMDTLRVKRW